MRATALLALLALLGCQGKDDPGTDTDLPVGDDTGDVVDADGDGSPASEDCDDDDASVYPDAVEACDGLDNNCDGEVDEGVTLTAYTDADADGYGDDATAAEVCALEEGQVELGGDCDDADPAYNPAAAEDDCADPNDYNCDGSVGYADNDGDGFAACEECDDGDAAVNPSASEVCNDVDDDCDGAIDDADDSLDASTGGTFYADGDGDGYGAPLNTTQACEAPSGYVSDDTDCDDGEAAVNPAAAEVCNDIDDDCDGDIDDDDASVDASTGSTYYTDGDGDGYGDAASSMMACEQPSGQVSDATDCDDGDASVNPAASEVCNDVDDDCDGDIDDDDASLDSSSASAWYSDADGDSYGDASAMTLACDAPSGTVSDAQDCDDGDASVNPAAQEVCNDVDDDCDGDIDDDDASVDTSTGSTFYTDSDGDGYGDASSSLLACEQPSGAVSDDTDCDDGEVLVNPGETDVCDGLDNDCDGVTDPTGVDTDGDGVYNCIDDTVYSYDFDDSAWTDWGYDDLGGGNTPNWNMSGGYLYERSNAARSIAYGPDLGELETYTITVDMMSNGAATDVGAIVIDYDGTDYWLAAWSDPNDYYSRHTGGGGLYIAQCSGTSCTAVATDYTTGYAQSYGAWITLAVEVDGPDMTLYYNGTASLTYTHTSSPIGAGVIGLYTQDNDSGLYYDNFEVTNP